MKRPLAVFGFIAVFLILIALPGKVFSDMPSLQFQGEGTPYFVHSSPDPVQMIPLEGGERLLFLWLQRHHQTRIQSIMGIFIDAEGEPESDEPFFLSNPEHDIKILKGAYLDNFISCIIDDQGSIFMSWINASDSVLSIQKLDSTGQGLWGDWGIEIDDLTARLLHNKVEQILPDMHGGCYIRTLEGIYALDEEGQLRENWPWHRTSPGDEWCTGWMYPDELGGFWFFILNLEADLIYGWNKLDYQGRLLFDPSPERQPWYNQDYSGLWPTIGLEGPMEIIYADRGHDLLGIFRVDEAGNPMGDEFRFAFDAEARESFDPRVALRLRNQRFVLQYATGKATLYDALNNTMPWGNAGINLNLNAATVGFIDMPEESVLWLNYTINNDNPSCYHLVPKLITSDGEVEDYPEIGNCYPLNAVGGANDDYWMLIKGTSGRIQFARYYLDKFDESGEPVWDESHLLPIKTRDYPGGSYAAPHVWNDEDDNFHILFPQREIGHTLINLDAEGQIIGDEWGTVAVPADSFEYDSRGNPVRTLSKTLTDQILYAWSPASYDTHNVPELIAFDRSGEVEWQLKMLEENNYPSGAWIAPRMVVSDNEEMAFVMVGNGVNGGGWHAQDFFITGIDLERGEILWQNELPDYLRTGQYDFMDFVGGAGGLYFITGSSLDTVRVRKFDLDGNRAWESDLALFRRQGNTRILAAAESDNGDLWICEGVLNDENDETAVWLKRFSGDGEVLADSIPVFQGPRVPITSSDYHIVPSQGMIWIYQDPDRMVDAVEAGLQCLTQDGEKLFEGNGWTPGQGPLDVSPEWGSFKGFPDGEGGIMYFWRFRDGIGAARLYSIKAMHFNSDARSHMGYENDGFAIIPRDIAPGDYFNYSVSPLSDGRFAITYADVLQILSETGPNDVPHLEDTLPSEAGLIALYPQPFNGRFTLTYRTGTRGMLKGGIYDITGREVLPLRLTGDSAAETKVSIDMANQPNGVYLLKLSDGIRNFHRKIALIK